MRNNTIVIGDTDYVVTAAYKEGALAMRKQIPWSCCPHSGERRDAWKNGHCNESGVEHIRFGKDLVSQPKQGIFFREDPTVRRTEFGVDKQWYRNALKTVSAAGIVGFLYG